VHRALFLYNGYRVFPGGKEWPGHDADLSPPSIAVVTKEWVYTSTPTMGRTACTDPQCLYRASVPVQSLSACTGVHFTYLYFYRALCNYMNHV